MSKECIHPNTCKEIRKCIVLTVIGIGVEILSRELVVSFTLKCIEMLATSYSSQRVSPRFHLVMGAHFSSAVLSESNAL